MIACRKILAREHDITEQFGACFKLATGQVCPFQRSCLSRCRRNIDAPGMSIAGVEPILAFCRPQGLAGAGIGRRGAVGSRERVVGIGRDLGAGAEAGVEQLSRGEAVELGGVMAEIFRLQPHRPWPVEAEPGQIVKDSLGKYRAAAIAVDILDTQPHRAVASSLFAREQGAVAMAEMEQAGRAGGKTCHGHRTKIAIEPSIRNDGNHSHPDR